MDLSKDTALCLAGLLAHESNSVPVRDAVADVRKILMGEAESIEAHAIVVFPKDAVSDINFIQ